MNDIKGILINFMLAGIILIGILSFSTLLGANYGKTAEYMQTEYINSSQITSQVNKTSNDGNEWLDAFKKDKGFIAFAGLAISSIWGIAQNMLTGITTFLSIFYDLLNIFYIPQIILGVITFIVSVVVIFLGWRLLKQGQ